MYMYVCMYIQFFATAYLTYNGLLAEISYYLNCGHKSNTLLTF